jgi:uncharacterized protein YjbI with pentapeptide repeats
MNRDETIALFLQGKEAWNAWAEKMLAERKVLEADGRWSAKKELGILSPKNDETRAWMEGARADFSYRLFLGDIKERRDGRDPAVEAILIEGDKINFEAFVFPGTALFEHASFARKASFDGAQFSGDALFGAPFQGAERFENTPYSDAAFNRAFFPGKPSFGGAIFSRDASFDNATFAETVGFGEVTFSGSASFDDARFWASSSFYGATFAGGASFRDVTFEKGAFFDSAEFGGDAIFRNANFKGYAVFSLVSYAKSAIYNDATFGSKEAQKEVDFTAIKADRAFLLSRVVFFGVPSFNQADFKQAPDLDDVRFPLPGFWRRHDASLVSQYRAIRRMAIQADDYEREQMAFKGEIRSKRGTEHKFYHAGLWYGLLYDGLSDFGRSTWRPLGGWLACIVIFGAYFLGQNETMTAARAKQPEPWTSTPIAYLTTAGEALWSPPYCYPGTEPLPADPDESPKDRFTGLVEKVRTSTNIVNEALSIAYHNAVIVLDSSGDSAHRAFGCLYGVERYGGNSVAYVPRSVAIASGIQKLLSAIFIFLFGLAVRNMLKVK